MVKLVVSIPVPILAVPVALANNPQIFSLTLDSGLHLSKLITYGSDAVFEPHGKL